MVMWASRSAAAEKPPLGELILFSAAGRNVRCAQQDVEQDVDWRKSEADSFAVKHSPTEATFRAALLAHLSLVSSFHA